MLSSRIGWGRVALSEVYLGMVGWGHIIMMLALSSIKI